MTQRLAANAPLRQLRWWILRLHYTPFRLAVVGCAVLAYCLFFAIAGPRLGETAATLAVLPVAVAGWYLGLHGGLLAGLCFLPLNALLLVAFTPLPAGLVIYRWPGALIAILAGGVAGWSAELVQRVREQARFLVLEREDLQRQIARRIEVEAKLRQANLEISASRDRALAGTRAKSAFLANMSHELRTPLTSIIGYAELILEEEGGGAPVADVAKILTAGQHLLRLIDDVLDLSRIEAGKLPVQIATVDVEAVVRDVTDTVQPLADAGGSTLEVKVEPEIGAMRSDPTRVRQILLNVLGNACKFTERGKITLTAGHDITRSGEWFVFTVADTGVGMTPEQRAQLFTDFPQGRRELGAASSAAKKASGAGLGLAITRGLCELLGGEIGVDSELGKGSTVTIVLPKDAPTPR